MKGITILHAYVEAANRAEFWRQAWELSCRRLGPSGGDASLYLKSVRYRSIAAKCYRRLVRRLGEEPTR